MLADEARAELPRILPIGGDRNRAYEVACHCLRGLFLAERNLIHISCRRHFGDSLKRLSDDHMLWRGG
jgi:hypothetical protein